MILNLVGKRDQKGSGKAYDFEKKRKVVDRGQKNVYPYNQQLYNKIIPSWEHRFLPARATWGEGSKKSNQ